MSLVEYDSDLISNSVNYHGHELLKLLVAHNVKQLKLAKLQNIDYHLFQERNDIRKNSSRSHELLQFIAFKSGVLFNSSNSIVKIDAMNPNFRDVYEHQYPLDYYLKSNVNLKMSQFGKMVQRGDILYVMVCCITAEKLYSLRVLACDNGRHLHLASVIQGFSGYKILMRQSDTNVDKTDNDPMQSWLIGTRLRVEVLEPFPEKGIIFVGTEGATLNLSENNIKLGKIIIADLPKIFTSNFKTTHLSDCIKKLKVFKNPNSVEQLTKQFEIPLTDYPSLMSNIRTYVANEDKAPALRQIQLAKWAHKHVADGVNQFKCGNHTLAFQCIEKALKIDPENEEAFVAKGALLANLSHYEKAIEQFQKALILNSTHQNANKYMCETLVELGRQHKEDDNFKDAEDCFKRCLEIDIDHAAARRCLEELAQETGDMTLLAILKKVEEPKLNEKDALLEIAAMEEQYIMDQKANEKVASPEVEQSYSQAPQLSPLSQKMAMNVNMWQQASNPPQVFNQPPQYYHERVDYTKPPPNLIPTSTNQEIYSSLGQKPVMLPYDQQVADFLKRLESGVPSTVEESEKTQRNGKPKVSSRSRRRYSTSSSSSSSSSSSNSSSSSSDRSHRHKQKKRKSSSNCRTTGSHKRRSESKKKSGKSKKRGRYSSSSSSTSRSRSKYLKRKSSKSYPIVDKKKDKSKAILSDVDSLEKKLQAYYENFNKISTSNSPAETKTKPSKKLPTYGVTPASGSSKTTKQEVYKGSTHLKVHPLFTQSSDSSEVDEPKKTQKQLNIKDIIEKEKSYSHMASKKAAALYKKKVDERQTSPKYGYYSNKPVYKRSGNLYPAITKSGEQFQKSVQSKFSMSVGPKRKISIEKAKEQIEKHIHLKETIGRQSRFGKWADESKPSPNTGSRKVDMFEIPKNGDNAIKSEKLHDQSLHDCEKYLEGANEKRIESMKKRNKILVKPHGE